MRLRVGTSGFGYREWRGNFYPADLQPAKMLPFYAAHFAAVEINASFYRLPAPSVLDDWRAQVPEDFLFAFKAPARITHRKRLRDAGEESAFFLARVATLGARLGPVLFQLPPTFPCDLLRLREFLQGIPRARLAFEFRHPSWFNEDLFALLREQGCALCLSDRDEAPAPPLVATADFAYVRLRRAQYSDAELGRWRERILSGGWPEAFVFFRHEATARGTAYAQKLQGDRPP